VPKLEEGGGLKERHGSKMQETELRRERENEPGLVFKVRAERRHKEAY